MRQRKPVLAPDLAGIEGAAPEGDGRKPWLPQPCPVTPLGKDGNRISFLDGSNQIITVDPDAARKGALKLWFGFDWLVLNFPEHPKGWKPGDPLTKFNQDDAQTALVEDCRNRGVFNPAGKVFGRGAHRFPGDPEQLALHMGRQVLLANGKDAKGRRARAVTLRPAGKVSDATGGDAFFPALDALPAPADEAATADEARDLLAMLGKWRWVEPDASSLLLLGFIGQMFFCGALDWRTHMWLAGPTASGKTSLQRIIRALLAHWCLFTEDASEAAIRQVLGDDTLPVMIDEAEAHDRPERLQGILNLMKKASSGAKIHRGGQDHKASEFTAQSCFLLSSVLHASMKGEDRNRIAILEMRAIPQDTPPLELELAHWTRAGRKMHRRIVDQWPRFDRTLAAYKAEIARRGFEGRWRDTYGTLLACADLLLFDFDVDAMVPDARPEAEGIERVARLVSIVAPAIARGRVEARTDVDRVIVHLASHMLPGAHGRPAEPLGLWIERAMTLKEEPGQFATDMPAHVIDTEARNKLKSHGLRVVNVKRKDGGKLGVEDARAEAWEDAYLAIAYATNKATCDIFRGSEWADGGWLQSFGKVPDAVKGAKVRFAGMTPDNAILVPLKAFRGGDDG